MFVGVSWGTWIEPIQAWGEHATQKGPNQVVDSNPGPSYCEVTALTTVPSVILVFWGRNHGFNWTSYLHPTFSNLFKHSFKRLIYSVSYFSFQLTISDVYLLVFI